MSLARYSRLFATGCIILAQTGFVIGVEKFTAAIKRQNQNRRSGEKEFKTMPAEEPAQSEQLSSDGKLNRSFGIRR
jgi:hypothetical protein